MKTIETMLGTFTLLALCTAGCVGNGDAADEQLALALPAVEEIQMMTPDEARTAAEREIDASNVDAAFAALAREVEGGQ